MLIMSEVGNNNRQKRLVKMKDGTRSWSTFLMAGAQIELQNTGAHRIFQTLATLIIVSKLSRLRRETVKLNAEYLLKTVLSVKTDPEASGDSH